MMLVTRQVYLSQGSPISYLHISIFDDNKDDNMLVRCRYFYLENRLENQYNTVELAIISKSLEPLGAISEIDGENFALLEH